MIRYDRLWETMAAKGMTQYRLIKMHNFSAGQIGRLKKNMHVSTHTLDTLCSLLECGINDIIEYVPDHPAGSAKSPAPKAPEPETQKAPEDSKEPIAPVPAEKAPAPKQKKADSSKNDKPKKAAKSKKGEKKASKGEKKGKEGKKNK